MLKQTKFPSLNTKLYVSERILLLRVVDVLALCLGFYCANLYLDFNYINFIKSPFSLYNFVFFVFYLVCAQVFEMYKLRGSISRFKTVKNLSVTTFVCVLVYLYTPIVTPVLPANRIEILTFFFIVFVAVFVWRNIYILMFSDLRFYKPVVIIGGDLKSIKKIIACVTTQANDDKLLGYVSHTPIEGISGHVNVLSEEELDNIITNNLVKEIIINLKGFSTTEKEFLNHKLARYFELGINVTNSLDYIEKVTECVPEENLNKEFYRYFKISDSHENRLYLLIVRCLDIVAALTGLLSLITIIPFVFLGNLVGNRGGLFYKQERVGEKGAVFWIVKFRSMVNSAEKNGAQWAVKNDVRVTPFGKFLRKTRLDEIPQFWNVLKGEMSLIGPRPERPQFVSELESKIPLYAIRHVIKPGLTGWAQVMYPYASTMEEQKDKLRYDLYYIKKRDLYIDFKIIIKTINTVLYFKGQ